MSKKAKSKVDWERIESDYRSGILSLREIAEYHPGVNHVAISRRADKEGWTRDLTARIKAKADELVAKKTVTPDVTERRFVTDKAIVEENGRAVADVRLSQRDDIFRARKLTMDMLGELERLPKENETLGIRSKILKSISDTISNLVSREREAWGIDNQEDPKSSQAITKIVREIVRPR